jgi:molecular chaperone GrpE
LSENRFEEHLQSEYDKENSVEVETDALEETNEGSEEAEITEEKKVSDKSQKDKETIKLEKALAEAIEERDSFKDSYQRTFSDYNNYRKRNQVLAAQAMKAGAGEVIEKILPVIDNFERALEHVNEEDGNPLTQGVLMVYKQLSDIITGMGVKEIPALGKEFDPNLHQAIQQVDAKAGEAPGTIAAVAQKGYMLDDKVLRHSMVIVNK